MRLRVVMVEPWAALPTVFFAEMVPAEVAWKLLGELQGDIKCLLIKSPGINGAC